MKRIESFSIEKTLEYLEIAQILGFPLIQMEEDFDESLLLV